MTLGIYFYPVLLAIFCVSSIECRGSKWKINVPLYLKRQYDAWTKNDSCNYERIKTIPAEVMLARADNGSSFYVKTNIADDGFEFKELKLIFEIRGISSKKSRNGRRRKYIAEVSTSGLNRDVFNVSSSDVRVEKNIWEMSFNITSLYRKSKNLFHKDATLSIKLLRKNKKTAKFLMKQNTKIYFLLYQKIKSCNLVDYIQYDSRFKISMDDLGSKSVLKNGASRRHEDPEMCHVKPSMINLYEIGFHFIIYPDQVNIGMCDGLCPLKNLQNGYQVIQVIHNFRNTKNRNQPSGCRPTQYGSMTLIYEDIIDKMPVMSKFVDTTIQQCGCS